MKGARLVVTAALLAVTACAGTPPEPARQYRLAGPAVAPAAATPDAAPGLALDRIELATFLDQTGIVYESADTGVHIARNHHWATPLVGQLRQRFAAALATILEPLPVYPRRSAVSAAGMQLDLSIDAFHGRDSGDALIAGTWRLRRDQAALANGEFRVQVPLEADGYDALVAALGEGVGRAARSIAAALSRAGVLDSATRR